MSGNKIIICPGAFYNEHVEQQNIFGVVNVYPPKDGERGGQTVSSVQLIDCSEDEDLEAEDVAAADFEADAADFENAADFKAAADEDERKAEKDAAAGISRKETGRGRKSEYLFALDEKGNYRFRLLYSVVKPAKRLAVISLFIEILSCLNTDFRTGVCRRLSHTKGEKVAFPAKNTISTGKNTTGFSAFVICSFGGNKTAFKKGNSFG